MRVRLVSAKHQDVDIRSLSEEAQNVIGPTDSAEWMWSIGAASSGSYGLTLMVDIEQQSSNIPLKSWTFDLTLDVRRSWHDSAEFWWIKVGKLIGAIAGVATGLAGIVTLLLVVPKRLKQRRESRRLVEAAQERDKATRESEEADERYRQTGYR